MVSWIKHHALGIILTCAVVVGLYLSADNANQRDARNAEGQAALCKAVKDVAAELQKTVDASLKTAPAQKARIALLANRNCASANPFQPLDYPQQTVNSRVPGISGPAVRAGSKLLVTGQKCNNSDKPVTIYGQISWQSVVPRGTNIPVGEGVGVRKPGCETFSFENPIPKDVEAAVKDAGRVTTWTVVGSETPEGPDGVKEPFHTENFKIVP